MRADQSVAPGRYALDADGAWHLFTDKAELAFKPVAVMKVKERIAADEPVEPMAQLAAFGEAIVTVARPEGGHVGFVTDAANGAAIEAVVKSVRTKVSTRGAARRIVPRAELPVPAPRASEATRTATPGDVFRAIADEFGILPAVGASRSSARFRTLVRRDEDADAARAYERQVEERQGRE